MKSIVIIFIVVGAVVSQPVEENNTVPTNTDENAPKISSEEITEENVNISKSSSESPNTPELELLIDDGKTNITTLVETNNQNVYPATNTTVISNKVTGEESESSTRSPESPDTSEVIKTADEIAIAAALAAARTNRTVQSEVMTTSVFLVNECATGYGRADNGECVPVEQ